MKEIRTSGPLMFSDPNCPTRVGEIINTISEIYDIPNPSEGMQVYVRDEKKTYTITGLKEAVIGGERVPDAKVDTFEAVKSQVEEIDNNFAEMQEALIDGSFVVGIASLANEVKAGAVTFEMLDGKLRLSVSVVDDLETANTLKPLSANQGKVLKELIDIINGTGEGSTDKKITDAIAALVDNAPENLDTLKGLADWIAEHGTEFAAVVETLHAHSENLADLNTTILNYNRKIGNYAPVDKATVVANLGTSVERGMVVTYYSTDGWKNIRYASSQATAEAFANINNWVDVDDFSAEDKTTLNSQVQKLIKLEGIAANGELAGVTSAGQYYYNTNDNIIKRYNGSVYITVPFHEGAIYSCKNLLYVWDGSKLVLADKQIRDDLKAISIDTDGMLLAVSDRVCVEIGTLNISASGGNMSATNRFRTTSYIQPPFAITMSAGFIVKYICKYDSKGRYLGYSTPTSSSKVNMEDDAFLYRIMFAKSDGSDIGEEELDYAVANVKGKVTFLQESATFLDSKQREFAEFSKQFTETQFVPAGFSSQIDGYYINGAGSMVSMDGFAVRTYTLDNVGLIKIEGTGGGVSRRYAFYSSEDVSENNVVLVGPKMDDTDFNEVIYVPDGAVMLAVTYRESWQQAIYVEKGKSVVPQFKRKKLKMLCFGNSFTIGSVGYVPFLMDKDIDLTIGIAFTSGGTLGPTYSGVENLYDKLTNDVAYTYFKYVNGAVSWVKKTVVPTEILADEDWDVVTLQQGSNNASDYTTYQPYLNWCIDLISQKVNKPVKFGWIIPHADANVLSNDKETSILSAAERVMNDTIIQFIIPYGTAIANARKTAFSTIGDGGNLLYEGKHLQNGLPQLVANYSTLLSIYEIVGVNDKSIAGMTSEEITDDWVSNHKIPNANAVGACVGVTSENCRIAAKCAIMATKKPFSVTDMTGLV